MFVFSSTHTRPRDTDMRNLELKKLSSLEKLIEALFLVFNVFEGLRRLCRIEELIRSIRHRTLYWLNVGHEFTGDEFVMDLLIGYIFILFSFLFRVCSSHIKMLWSYDKPRRHLLEKEKFLLSQHKVGFWVKRGFMETVAKVAFWGFHNSMLRKRKKGR